MMNFFLIILIIFMILMILVTPFRQFIIGEIVAIRVLLRHYLPGLGSLGVYGLIIIVYTLVGLILMSVAIMTGSSLLTGLLFIFSLTLILITWMPIRLVISIFGKRGAEINQYLKTIIAWMAFVGFLGMVSPSMLTSKAIIGVALVALILMAASTKLNLMDKIIIPLVLLMCLVLAWENFFPENFRSSKRYTASWFKKFDTFKDRSSIKNESDAGTTYGLLLRDVNVLYHKSPEGLNEVEINLPRGTSVLVVNHKNEVLLLEGQTFLEVRLSKGNGSFVNGPTYLVESELIQIASPRDIFLEDNNLLPRTKKLAQTAERIQVQVLDCGRNVFQLRSSGDRTSWLQFPSGKSFKTSISSENKSYSIVMLDGTEYNPGDHLPDWVNPTFYLKARSAGETVTINVIER